MDTCATDSRIRNALSIDVEDWFQVSAFAPHIDRSDWERLPCRVERNVERLLERLDQHGAQATFFTLGWIAERYPHLVRRI
ncbi:MAG: polysaccharide deacetylase family protein, partial [Burkholderiaceae bacterium]